MSTTAITTSPTHTCVYFDDGAEELLCGCGQRALYLLDGDEELLVVLVAEDEAVVTSIGTVTEAPRELAVSA